MERNSGKKGKYHSKRLYFLSPDLGKRGDTWHNILIAEITEALYKMGHHKLWYDHIKEIVPKSPLPNTINGRRWDITVEVEEGVYALIEILMFKEPMQEIELEGAPGDEDG